jgi:antitoxin (DNA-binding transcriptional repressor) of toxin-antitoxin stability system
MRQIGASDFKARCLAILDEVAETGESVQVLKRGKVVARLIPAFDDHVEHAQDTLTGTVTTLGDVLAPTVQDEEIDAVTGRALEPRKPRARKRSR